MQSFLRSIVCFIYFTAALAARKDFRCDYKYVPAIKGWLKYHEMPSNWNEARLRCEMEGATIASPLTNTMKESMLSILTERARNCAVFTGIHATFSRGDFYSVEGVPLAKIPHKWAVDEPDNFKDEEDCLVLLPDGTMGDVRCKDTFSYFCHKKQSNLVINACGTIDPGYNLDTRTGHCYKFHRVPRTWSRAYMACSAEGGHLAIINSDVEATVLRELFAKNPGGTMVGNFWKDVAFVGFHDWTEHGDWRTIHGQSLTAAGYDKFSLGEPNNSTAGEFCGSIYRTALFDDLWCENRYAFICEKEPDSLMCDEEQ